VTGLPLSWVSDQEGVKDWSWFRLFAGVYVRANQSLRAQLGSQDSGHLAEPRGISADEEGLEGGPVLLDSLLNGEPGVRSELVPRYGFVSSHEPFEPLDHGQEVVGKHRSNPSDVREPPDCDRHSLKHVRIDGNAQSASVVRPWDNPPGNEGGPPTDCSDLEIVADPLNPPGEPALIYQAIQVVNRVTRFWTRPDLNRIPLAEWMTDLKVASSRDRCPNLACSAKTSSA